MSRRARPGASHEHGLALLAAVALLRVKLHPATLGAELPRGGIVCEPDLEGAHDLLLRARVLHGCDQLDAMVEVTRHQVGAPKEELRLPVRFEDKEAAVLEKPPQDAADADRLAEPRDPGPQGADAPRNHVDTRAGLRREYSVEVSLQQRRRIEPQAGEDLGTVEALAIGAHPPIVELFRDLGPISLRKRCGRPKPVR